MKKILITFFIALFYSSLALAASEIYAVIGDDIITSDDYDNRVKILEAFNKRKPTQAEINKMKANILKALINEKVYSQAANKAGINVSTDEVKQQINGFEQRNGMEAGSLKKYMFNNDSISNQIKSELMWAKYVNAKLRPSIKISNKEVKEFMNQLKPVSHVSMYSMYFNQKTIDNKKTELEADIRKVKNCPSLDAIATKYKLSIDKISEKLADLNPSLHQLAMSYPLGKPSDVYKTGDLYRVFVVCKRQYGKVQNKDKGKYKELLIQTKLGKKAEAHLEGLKKKTFIEIKTHL